MSKRSQFIRQSLIIRKLQKQRVTFIELEDFLELESELQGYDFTISKRTFKRDREDINSIWDIDIQFDFSKKQYFIEVHEDEENDNLKKRMLEAFEMYSALTVNSQNGEFINFETRKAVGSEHFYGILHAIKNQLYIDIDYQKFQEDEPICRKLAPCLLKEAKGRWYVVAIDTTDHIVKTFGLDRIVNIIITQVKFPKPNLGSIKGKFSNSFGIINYEGEKAQKIVLTFESNQGKYIESYPLHNSQKLTSKTNDTYTFELFLQITDDFIMELLSFGNSLKIISPKELKDEIIKELSETLKRYKSQLK
jgi:predicted DNA-binding transcriptional regulator YafY